MKKLDTYRITPTVGVYIPTIKEWRLEQQVRCWFILYYYRWVFIARSDDSQIIRNLKNHLLLGSKVYTPSNNND